MDKKNKQLQDLVRELRDQRNRQLQDLVKELREELAGMDRRWSTPVSSWSKDNGGDRR